MLLVTVGRNIRTRRKECGLSLMKLFGRCGIDASNLSKIECGTTNATLYKLHKIARALECSLFDFFVEADGSHSTAERFIEKCLDFPASLRETYSDPFRLAWVFDTKFLDKYSVEDIERIANASDSEEDEDGVS